MQNKYFELAKKISRKSQHPQHKMGCVIVNRHAVISCAFNSMKSHPVSKTHGNTLHAEISALIGLSYEDTSGGTVYVYRERQDGSLGMARPCPVCMEALKLANIKKVCYSSNEGFVEERI